MTTLERLGPWPARVLWLAAAVLAVGPLGDALDGRSAPVAATVLAGLALAWTVAAVALLVPRAETLTMARVVVPAAVPGALATVAAGTDVAVDDVALVAATGLATVAVLLPTFGEAWVDGSSYGNERRFPLRAPVLFTVLVAPLTWVLVVAGAVAGPLLLAARQWVPGVVALVLGWVVAAAGFRSLHQLSRRWLVLVPAGVVLHDQLAMPEPQLLFRRSIAALGPAPRRGRGSGGPDDRIPARFDGDPGGEGFDDGPARDLTGGAAGLALQIELTEPVELLVRTGGRGAATERASRLLFTPTRPARVLEAARERRIPLASRGAG